MRRVIGAAGRVFITAGILILLFVAYQLWGTGVFEARAQSELRDDFEAQLEQASGTTTDDGDPTSTTTTTTTTTSPAPPPIPPDGEAVAIIRIPKIGLDKVVVEGTTVADLRKGPGHYVGTPLPGQIGNAAIAGHRTTYGAPFGNLDQLAEDDVITVETLSGSFDYRVMGKTPDNPLGGVFVVKPSDTQVLAPTPSEATLTLTSCNPKYSARERIIVKAEFDVGANQPQPQAPATEPRVPDDLDAGLSGEHDSRAPTYLWGLIAAVVGGLWWLVFHRYRRWTTWLAGAIVFTPVVFVFYFFLERVLPSNY